MARLLRLTTLIAVLAALGQAGCGDDDDDGNSATATRESQTETTEPTPGEEREALKDTSTKPDIPRPTGFPPRRLETDDLVLGKGPPAKTGDTLTVHYAGVTFSTGDEFDTSWDSGNPYTFRLGGRVIEGWNKGLAGMRKGGRRMLTIPPELAYGRAGFPPAIGPNETLVFVVDLVKLG